MIKLDINNYHVIVDHDCKGKNEKQIADELIKALDILCADLYVDNSSITTEEKMKKSLETRNTILDHMKNIKYSCEEYFELEQNIDEKGNSIALKSNPIYVSYDGSITLNADEMKSSNINFYNSITSYRCLLNNIDDGKKDIKHILKSILESNSTYFVVGIDAGDMDSTVVFGKVDLVRVLKKYDFEYGIGFIDYDDLLLTLEIFFKVPIPEFSNSNNVEIYLSYNDLAEIIKGINMDNTMTSNWNEIQYWWSQKKLFKDLD